MKHKKGSLISSSSNFSCFFPPSVDGVKSKESSAVSPHGHWLLIRRCRHKVEEEEGAPARWSPSLAHCRVKHNKTHDLWELCTPSLKSRRSEAINKDQSLHFWLGENCQHLRKWRLLDSTQEVWIKTSRYNVRLTLNCPDTISPGGRSQINATSSFPLAARGQSWDHF